MSKVVVDITMSLDGYVAPAGAEGADADIGMDDLQAWVMHQDEVDAEVLRQATLATGAVVMGRRLFDIVDAPGVWTKDMAYGAQPPDSTPLFVVSHSRPEGVRLARELGMTVDFVNGLPEALDRAIAAAGGGNVVVMGGGDVVGQAIELGLVDELQLHLSPMVLGGGTPLFRVGTHASYRQREVRASANAVHLTYERTATA